MNKSRRQARILEIVAREGGVSANSLAETLGTSAMTIRRDFLELSGAGKLRRLHGGATLTDTGVVRFEFARRQYVHGPEKRAIALAAAEMIKPGMAVSLDTGTTTLEVARAIRGYRELTVLTSSLAIASVLYSDERDGDLVLLGGLVRRASPDLTGPLTVENLQRFRVHTAVLGADAINRDGTFATDESVSQICRAMASNAERVMVVADSAKFSRTAFTHCLAFKDIDVLVTDDGCAADIRGWLEQEVRKVVYARVRAPHAGQETAKAGKTGPAQETANAR